MIKTVGNNSIALVLRQLDSYHDRMTKSSNQRKFSTVTEHLSSNRNNYQTTLLEAKRSANFIAKVKRVWPQLFTNNVFQGTEADYCQPAHFQNQTLFIMCDLAIVHNQLRFNQQTLLDGLHDHGFTGITSLKLMVQHNQETAAPQPVKDTERAVPSQQTLQSLLSCANNTKDTTLQQSLEKLYQRLKNQ